VRIQVFPDAHTLAGALADVLTAALADQPALVLGLPTGRTPVLLYAELAGRAAAGRVDMTGATTFNLDEFLGVAGSDPASYRQFMETHLFKHVGIDPRRINFLNGAAHDVAAECQRYEDAIVAAGGIGLQVLGIGSNGHIGFNEPGPTLAARTHRVTLKPETRRANAGLFGGDLTRVPTEALSMGMGTILHAARLVLIATGPGKADCVRQMIEGPLTTMLPASFLQVHPDVLVMLDEPAAAGLKRAEIRSGEIESRI
jgi:glucosamine-6-phosphate deaminase